MPERTSCETCPHLYSCAYPYLFKTPVPGDAKKLRRYPNAPPPYIIEPQDGFSKTRQGQTISVGLVLVGRANQYLSIIIQAMRRAGLVELGWGFKKLKLIHVTQQLRGPSSSEWQTIFETRDGSVATTTAGPPRVPTPEPRTSVAVALRFHSASKIRCRGRYLGPDEVGFRDILSTLLRRISMLSYFHTDQPFETEFAELVQASRNVEIARRTLTRRPWTRYSAAQQESIKMDGCVGEIAVRSDEIERFWPLLWLGQWTHVGKGASMGLGGYTLVRDDKLAAAESG
jgi:hypothetical protein